MAKPDDVPARLTPVLPLPPPPLPPPTQPPAIRSALPTLVMGGNVNAPTGSLPPPPVVPSNLVAKAPVNSAPATLPGRRVPRASAPSLGLAHTESPHAQSGARVGAVAFAAGVKRVGQATARWLSQALRPIWHWLRVFPFRAWLVWLVAVVKLRGPYWWAVCLHRVRWGLHRVRWGLLWLQKDRRRSWLAGGVAFVLFGGVGLCSFTSEPPDVTTDVRVGTALPQQLSGAPAPGTGGGDSRGSQTEAHAATRLGQGADEPAARPALAKGAADDRFLVRERKSLTSCDVALGKPFAPERDTNSAEAGAFWTRSRKSLMLGKHERAVAEMCQSASWDLSSRGSYGLSEYYFQQSDFDAALQWAERVPDGSRRYVDARAMIGDIRSQQGDVVAARQAYFSAWNMAPNDAAEQRKVAASFAVSAAKALRKKDWWTAERFYRRALTLDVQNGEAAIGLARVFLYFDYPKAASAWANEALALDGRSATAALVACEANVAAHNKEGARAALAKLRLLAPDDPNVETLAARVNAL